MLLFAFVQDLNPLGNRILSTVVAALPVVVLFYLLVGRRWLASWAGAAGAVVAILLAWLVYKMPLDMAGASFVHGAVFGLLPIGWTVFAAMLLYNVTVETGQFAVIRRSIGGLSGDARVQAMLIGFCFGAFMEGAAGAGSPVAICGAMLVGLGVPPFRAAVICLIANTSPVCYGGLGRADPDARQRRPASAGRHDQHHVRAPAPVPVVPDPAVHGQDDVYLAADARRCGRPCWSAAGRSRCSSSSSPRRTPTGCRPIWPLTDIGGGDLLDDHARPVPEVRLEAARGVEEFGPRPAGRPQAGGAGGGAARPAGRTREGRSCGAGRRADRQGRGQAADRRARDPRVVAVDHHGRVPGVSGRVAAEKRSDRPGGRESSTSWTCRAARQVERRTSRTTTDRRCPDVCTRRSNGPSRLQDAGRTGRRASARRPCSSSPG